jgi:hypothetical protein
MRDLTLPQVIAFIIFLSVVSTLPVKTTSATPSVVLRDGDARKFPDAPNVVAYGEHESLPFTWRVLSSFDIGYYLANGSIPLAEANQYTVPFENPSYGRIRTLLPAVRLSDTPASIRTPALELDQHNAEVLLEMGYSPGRIYSVSEIKG